MTSLYKGVVVMHMLLCTQVAYSILPMSVMHLVSKYGHYEGAVTSGLCGKLMANREGQKRRDSCLCHHPDRVAVKRAHCATLRCNVPYTCFFCSSDFAVSSCLSYFPFFFWLCALSSLSVPRRPGV